MHSSAVRDEILALVEAGVNDCEISRLTGVARTTVRDLRSPNYERKVLPGTCWRCWGGTRPAVFSDADYAELLGLYLGDGHIVRAGRTERLRITMDSNYPVLNAEVCQLLERCFPSRRVGLTRGHRGENMAVVSVYANHLSCLLPQHGPGKKQDRVIALESWQLAIVRRAPFSLLRGLLMSDGCHFVNRTGKYEYFSYAFANRSCDILDLFCDVCEMVGVVNRRTRGQVRINDRASVARLIEYVGVKA